MTPSWRSLIPPLLLALTVVGCTTPSGITPPRQIAVVSAHATATEAGMEILRAGGTAADAAVAVAATLSVVEPWFSSALGGGSWGLYYQASSGRVTSLDAVGPTGSLATPADFAARAGLAGMHQANVPGAWDGWMLWLREYGSLPLGEVLAPAIRAAREGSMVSGPMSVWLQRLAPFIAAHPDTAAIYHPSGVPLRQADTFYQHALADTFDALIAAHDAALPNGRAAALQAARDHYYRGPIAAAIVAFSEAAEQPGYLTLSDFATFEAAIVDPIDIPFGDGDRVYQNPPNSQGIAMLQALRILDGSGLAGEPAGSAGSVHLQVEALKLALSDRNAYVGDPAVVNVPVAELLSAERAALHRARIRSAPPLAWPFAVEPLAAGPAFLPSAVPGVEPDPNLTGTTTFQIVDAQGNAASVTTSLGAQFYVIGDTGIHINNRMRFVAIADGDPNQLAGGKKVRHTSNPYMVLRGGRPYLLGGQTGADLQVQGQLQQVVNVLVYGMTPAAALAAPRFTTTGFPATTYPYAATNRLQLEVGWSAEAQVALQARGHSLEPASSFGVGHLLLFAEEGIVVAREPRYATSAGAVETLP
jgi:gamma-glutamyltranspeptidase / glutathione hydrolase